MAASFRHSGISDLTGHITIFFPLVLLRPGKKMSLFTTALMGVRGCRREMQARRDCYERQGKGVNTEACYAEELSEKRCLSFHCCPFEAKSFYGTPEGVEGKNECSLWAEYFAFGGTDNDDNMSAMIHSQGRDEVSANDEKSKRCRRILMDLSICLSNYSETLQEIESRRIRHSSNGDGDK